MRRLRLAGWRCHLLNPRLALPAILAVREYLAVVDRAPEKFRQLHRRGHVPSHAVVDLIELEWDDITHYLGHRYMVTGRGASSATGTARMTISIYPTYIVRILPSMRCIRRRCGGSFPCADAHSEKWYLNWFHQKGNAIGGRETFRQAGARKVFEVN